jgi:hypothetical protein
MGAEMNKPLNLIASLLLFLLPFGASASYFDSDEVKCGPVVSIKRTNLQELGELKLRIVYREVRNPYTHLQKTITQQTIAYETFPNGKRVAGVLDFYQFESDRPIVIYADGDYLVIKHKYGTHMTPLLGLYSSPAPAFEATRFFNSENPCGM